MSKYVFRGFLPYHIRNGPPLYLLIWYTFIYKICAHVLSKSALLDPQFCMETHVINKRMSSTREFPFS